MRKSKRLVTTVIAISATAALPTAVLAAPAPFEGLPVSCAAIGDTILTGPGNGPLTPGFIEGTNGLLVPYVLDVTVSGPDGSTTTNATKAASLPADAITCTIDTILQSVG